MNLSTQKDDEVPRTKEEISTGLGKQKEGAASCHKETHNDSDRFLEAYVINTERFSGLKRLFSQSRVRTKQPTKQNKQQLIDTQYFLYQAHFLSL